MFIVCMQCPLGAKVEGEAEEIESLLGEGAPSMRGAAHHTCPECGAPCTSAPFADAAVMNAKHVRTLTPMEAHLLFEGMGFPEERDCVADIVRQEFTKPVARVVARTVPNTSRSVLHSIEFKDGTTMFFSGSHHGALIHRIRKPEPYTTRETNDQRS